MKLTKTEEKIIAQAKEEDITYLQKFVDYHVACPHCLEPLNRMVVPATCGCSTWPYDFEMRRFKRQPNDTKVLKAKDGR